VIGEKAIEINQKSEGIVSGIRLRRNFDDINAFSIIDVKIDNRKDVKDIFEFLEGKNYNVLLVAELRKRGEQTWNRISIINRYTWQITGTSSLEEQGAVKTDESSGTKTSQQMETTKDSDLRIKPFYVVDEILSDSPYIREGDYVQVFFFNDVTKSQVYLNDLKNARKYSRPLASIDSQEMYLVTTGSTPQKYSAREGDEIRLRFLRAEYSIKPNSQQKIGDIVSVEDEIFFTFKEYGIKLFISPTIVYGSKVGKEFDSKNFDLVGKNPSFGSNIYIAYEGRNPLKKVLNYLPGIHLSLLGLNNSEKTKFTIGFVTSIVPFLRGYFGIFYGWYDLKEPVIGINFSPNIKFKPLVGAEKNSEK
jgi:hypothetical protein